MNKNIKYFTYLIALVLIILLINILFSQAITLETPTFLKVLGNVDTWILFNGSLIGSLIGGIIAGIIAFKISKLQIEKENENNFKIRKLAWKYSLQVDVSKKILDTINVLLVQHSMETEIIDNLFSLIQKYFNSDSYKNKVEASHRSFNDMRNLYKLNFNNLIEENRKDFEYQDRLSDIYFSYTIVVFENKSSFEQIIKNLKSLEGIKTNIKETFEKLIKVVEDRKDIDNEVYSILGEYVKEFKAKVRPVIHELNCFNVDIQNTLSFLFEHKIEKPKYSEQM